MLNVKAYICELLKKKFYLPVIDYQNLVLTSNEIKGIKMNSEHQEP